MPHTGNDRRPPLRPLLPAPLEGAFTQVPAGKHKRKRTTAACAACRTRKTKCDGERPQCEECTARSTPCEYSSTEAQNVKKSHEEALVQHSAYEVLFQLLRTRPEDEAQEILRRVRSGANIEAIVGQITAGELLLQLHAPPETERRSESG